MSKQPNRTNTSIIAEMSEFAGFDAGTQRYIRRSLDVGLNRHDAIAPWSRDQTEQAAIKAQTKVYEKLVILREQVPMEAGLEGIESFVAPLMSMSAFDLGQERLPSFGSYRFLYERLLGARARRWLPSAFCGAAAAPHLRSNIRKDLLQSISEAAATAPDWSTSEPKFFPEWVTKVPELT